MQRAKEEHEENVNVLSEHEIWQSIFECYSTTADLDEAFAIDAQPLDINIRSSELCRSPDVSWAASDLNILEHDAKHLLNNEFNLECVSALCDSLNEMEGCIPQDGYHYQDDYDIIEAWGSHMPFPTDEAPCTNADVKPISASLEGTLLNEGVLNVRAEWGSEFSPSMLQDCHCDKSERQEFLSNSRYIAGIPAKSCTELEQQQGPSSSISESERRPVSSTRKAVMPINNNQQQRSDISYNELCQYFHMPITQAARELKVGLTVLKKRCREFGIPRWPHRKMKSLGNLIRNIQELAKNKGGISQDRLRNAVEILEEQRRLMEEMPGIEMAKRIKRLRQACFKANYKKRRAALNSSRPSNQINE